jgi:hypothetical protein
MVLLLQILGVVVLTELTVYLAFLIRREKTEQKDYETAKLAHVENNLPPSLWE